MKSKLSKITYIETQASTQLPSYPGNFLGTIQKARKFPGSVPQIQEISQVWFEKCKVISRKFPGYVVWKM